MTIAAIGDDHDGVGFVEGGLVFGPAVEVVVDVDVFGD